MLYESLVKRFGYDAPFEFSEIEYEGYSKYQISRAMRKLCEEKKVVRFEKGLYYIPCISERRVSIFRPIKIVEKKYISDGKSIFGYFSGRYLEYEIGISKLKPATIEIYTNSESRDTHRVNLGGQQLKLHKPRTDITKYNAGVLSFLELMNGIDIEDLDEYKKKLLADYITEHYITKRKITEHIKYFPNKTCRNLIESEVIYSVKL